MLQIETVAIDSVLPDPSNTRIHDERNLNVIKSSLARFGQQKPIVVDQKNIIRAGNGTWAAAKALGWTEIIIHRTTLTGADAAAFSIADNRTSDLSDFDPSVLLPQLDAIADEVGMDLSSLGFENFELDDMREKLEGVADAPGAFKNVDEHISTEFKCPKCGYEWSGGTGKNAASENGSDS